jgi:hypothetical protein
MSMPPTIAHNTDVRLTAPSEKSFLPKQKGRPEGGLSVALMVMLSGYDAANVMDDEDRFQMLMLEGKHRATIAERLGRYQQNRERANCWRHWASAIISDKHFLLRHGTNWYDVVR